MAVKAAAWRWIVITQFEYYFDAALAKQEYSGKLYNQFIQGTSYFNPGERAFDAYANSGMVFEAAQRINLESSPVLALFFSDASFSGQHMTHHPIYSMSFIF